MMSSHKDYVSAIPPELLARIFRAAQLPEQDDDDRDDEQERTQSVPLEILVSQVSRYWRTTALGTGLLWRNISVSQSCSVDKLRTYLARSGTQTPLHVQVAVAHRQATDVEFATMQQKLDLMFEQRERWQRLMIQVDIERAELPLVTRMYDCTAPALERLVLCIDDIDEDSLPNAQVRRADMEQILTQGCPQLKVLRLRGLSTHFFRPSLHNVTTLYLEQTRGLFLGFEQFKHLLTSAPQLAHLSVHDTLIDDSEEAWPLQDLSSIPAPQLTALRLSHPGSAQPLESGILLALYAPLLTSLVVKNPTYAGLTPFVAFPGIYTKFALRTLAFCDFDYNSADRLRPLTKALPCVSEFTRLASPVTSPSVLLMLAGEWVSTDILAEEMVSSSELWPELHTINTTLDISDLPLLRSAVERRKRVGYPLRVVRLPPSVFQEAEEDDDDAETLEWLSNNLEVLEPFVAMDRWPPGEEHDPEDNLFT
ncbi:hypothetical protein C8F01DRAFT_700936 [Mycena amicta]|nr:hypothetical protein C8F01DRAFT_700936 [Mycena amicta]